MCPREIVIGTEMKTNRHKVDNTDGRRSRRNHAGEELRRNPDASVAERTEEPSSLKEFMTSVSRSLNLITMAPASLSAIAGAADADITMMFLREGKEIRFLQAHCRQGCEAYAGPRGGRRIGECLCGMAAAGEPIFSTDIRVDRRRLHAECVDAGIVGFAALPLNAAGRTLGVLCVASLAPRDFQRQANLLQTSVKTGHFRDLTRKLNAPGGRLL